MNSMMKSLLTSRKFLVLILSLISWSFGRILGVELDAETVETVVGLVMAWLVAQGLADAGAGGSTRYQASKNKRKPRKVASKAISET